MFPLVPFNINKGLVALLLNAVVMVAVSLMSPRDEQSIAKLMLTRKA